MQDPDTAWVGGFLDRVLGLWRQHADTPSGLFDPYLDRQWRHHEDGPRTLVSQCRLIYVFSRAYERSGDQAYADLAQRGIEALIRYFRDADDEGWVWACQGDGSVQDDTLRCLRPRLRHPGAGDGGGRLPRTALPRPGAGRPGRSCSGASATSTAG